MPSNASQHWAVSNVNVLKSNRKDHTDHTEAKAATAYQIQTNINAGIQVSTSTREVQACTADAREGEEGARKETRKEDLANLASISMFALVLSSQGR